MVLKQSSTVSRFPVLVNVNVNVNASGTILIIAAASVSLVGRLRRLRKVYSGLKKIINLQCRFPVPVILKCAITITAAGI